MSASPPPNGNRGSDDADDMRLYAIAFAAHRPEPGESNAESAERSRRIDAHVEALKLEGGVLSQTGSLLQANTGFWDDEYVKGKRSPSPPASPVPVGLPPPNPAPANQSETTASRCVAFLIREESQTASVDIDLESPAECRLLSAQIFNSLFHDNWKPDFKAHHIPSRSRDASVHDTLSNMLAKRNAIEEMLDKLMTYEHPDGTPKLRNEADVETVYQRLNTRYNNVNRAMLTVYAQFLIADLPDDSPIDGTALAAMSIDGTSAAGAPCPYSHSKDQPTPPITVPKFETIVISDEVQQALLVRHVRPPAHTAVANTVWAVADSGASHILVRESDSHILCDHEFSGQQAPFAVLKTANGEPLAAIGRGTHYTFQLTSFGQETW